MQIVRFSIGEEEYAFDIQDVQEIVRSQKTTKIPDIPEYFEGIINLRGKVIPVLDLSKKYCLRTKEENESKKLIVLNMENDKQMAIRTDDVTGVLTIEKTNIDSVPNVTNSSKESCLKGVVKIKNRLIILLDKEKLLLSGELPQIKPEDIVLEN